MSDEDSVSVVPARPTYNHTRGDSPRTPCPRCAPSAAFGGMSWPLAGGAALDELEWRLRHAPDGLDASDAVRAATVLAAYRELVACPRAKRERVVRHLRAALALVGDEGDE